MPFYIPCFLKYFSLKKASRGGFKKFMKISTYEAPSFVSCSEQRLLFLLVLSAAIEIDVEWMVAIIAQNWLEL